jgi:RHS repeat-associated protein
VTPPAGSAQDYAWDAYGDLTSADGVGYGYDALGRLVTRTPATGAATSLSYVGTSDSLASDGTDNYTYTPSGTITSAGQPGQTAYSTITDQHGDVVAAFSPAGSTTALAADATYSPYGTATATSGTMPAAGYQGDYTDPSTGLVYMNARWYNPANGTFVSSDTLNGSPVPATVDGNPYAYADGNPLTQTDPTGHCMLGSSSDCWGWGCIGWMIVCGAQQIIGPSVSDSWGCFVSVCSAPSSPSPSPSPSPAPCVGVAGLPYMCGPSSSLPAPPAYPAPNPTQQPPDCGWKCAVGVGVAFCALDPEACAGAVGSVFTPPPPPPPPQNCYAAGTCTPPNASDTFKDRPTVTEPKPTDAKNPEHVPGGQVIDEPTPTVAEHPVGEQPAEGNTTGNEASGQNGSGQGNSSTSGPATPEPSGTGDGSALAGSGDTPGSAGDTPSPGTSDSSGSGSGDSGDPANQDKEPLQPGKFKFTPKQRVLINAGLGAGGALINDWRNHTTDPVTYVRDAGIGFATESIGGFGEKVFLTIFWDASGSLLDSAVGQGFDKGWSHVSIGQVAFNAAAGGELGAFGYANKLIGPLGRLPEDIAYNLVYGLADLGASACNNYQSEVESKGC